MKNYGFSSKREKSREEKPPKLNAIEEAFLVMLGERYNAYAPFRAECKPIQMDSAMKKMVEDIIAKARKADDKVAVKKDGSIRDCNGSRYDGFAFEAGRYRVGETLYVGIVVYQPSNPTELQLLLIRSDQTESKEVTLFPQLGTSQDWSLMRKCAKRHSPKWASQMIAVNVQDSQSKAAEMNAAATLEILGHLKVSDLDVLSGMSAPKMHFMELLCVVALNKEFPPELRFESVHTVVSRSHDDLDEIRRAARACDLTALQVGYDRSFPVIELCQVGDISACKQIDRFVLMTYQKRKIAEKVIAEVERLQASSPGTGEFAKVFPALPVLVGDAIWSKRSCVEIDMRDQRFSDRELEVARVLAAELVLKRAALIERMRMEMEDFLRSPDRWRMTPERTWFQCFHNAAAAVLFPAFSTRVELLEIFKDADAARLRLREDREARYKRAMDKLREATAEAPWVEPDKPKTLEAALKLLEGEKDAFLYYPEGAAHLCFTEASLCRMARIQKCELDDFVAELKRNHLLEKKTAPVTFAKGERQRLIRIRAEAVTVTGGTE